MAKYLYIFAYRTPAQHQAFETHSSEEASSEALFIEADSPPQALAWGREISEAFLNHLFKDPNLSWKAQNFPHWIETDPRQEYPADILARLPTVSLGTYPDFTQFKH